MRDTNHLTRRGAVYYYRARIPQDLEPVYGKKMLSFSLGTSNKAQAKSLALDHSVRFDKEFSRHRGIQRPTVRAKAMAIAWTEDAISHFCNSYLFHELRHDDKARGEGLSDISLALDVDIYGCSVESLRQAYAYGQVSDIALEGLRSELSRQGFIAPMDFEQNAALLRRFQETQIQAYDSIARRRKGDIVPTPKHIGGGLSLMDALDYWSSQSKRDPQTYKAHLQVLNTFIGQFPGMSASATKKTHIVQFKDTLLSRGLASKTVEKYIGFLHAILQVCADNDKLEFNPASGVRVPRDKGAKRKRLPFSRSELTTIFAGNIFTKKEMPRARGDMAHYWLPLLGLFTGARLEELAQLELPADIRHDKDLGDYLVVTDEGDDQELKNESSRRRIPLHPELLRLGFMTYVDKMSERKSPRLFPDLLPDSKGNLSGSYSKAFGRYLDSLSITDRKKVFHSFRHNYVDICRECGVSDEHRDSTTGHARGKQSDDYGSGEYPLAPLFAAVAQISYKGLDLSHLYP